MHLFQFIRKRLTHSEPRFVNRNPKYSNYEIGDWTYGNPTIISENRDSKLRIGRFCSIAKGVTILLGGEHRVDWVTTYPFSELFAGGDIFLGHPRSKGDVIIGNDVWIGRDAFILSGIEIGNGAVIGARSVVTKDVAPYLIVAGNPAQPIRFRVSHRMIEDLQHIAWWDWPVSQIEEALPLLLSRDIEAFIAKYGTK